MNFLKKARLKYFKFRLICRDIHLWTKPIGFSKNINLEVEGVSMKVSHIIMLFFACSVQLLQAQNKQDYHWFFGNAETSTHFDFNKETFDPQSNSHQQKISFDRNNASVSDKNGNLLFYTNGCAVADASHEIMENGDSINAGAFFDEIWEGDCYFGYPGKQDVLILQDPNYESGYYLIHKTREYNQGGNPQTFTKYLKYTYIDMTLNNGLGAVTEKNKIFFESNFPYGFLSAIKAKDSESWWITQMKDSLNLLHVIELNEQGFSIKDSLLLGEERIDTFRSYGSEVRFSPDGTKFAYFTKERGLWLYDFDRTDASFSNLRQISFSKPESMWAFSSVEFSPNSELLYLMSGDSLWQVDLNEAILSRGLELIDVHDDVPDPIDGTFFTSALGPDCRIYIREGNSSYSMHVINKPNEKGKACEFVQRGIKLPIFTSTGSFPNFPRYRVDDVDKCDPTITSIFGEAVYFRKDLMAYPNPCIDILKVDIPSNESGQLFLFDLNGRMIKSFTVERSDKVDIDLSFLESGSYSLEFVPKDNQERLVWTTRVIKTSL